MNMSESASVSGLKKLRLTTLSFQIQVESVDNLIRQQNCGAHCIVTILNISNYKLSLGFHEYKSKHILCINQVRRGQPQLIVISKPQLTPEPVYHVNSRKCRHV